MLKKYVTNDSEVWANLVSSENTQIWDKTNIKVANDDEIIKEHGKVA